MIYEHPNEIQPAIFTALNEDANILQITGGAIFDHVSTSQVLPEIYVRIGDEHIKNRSSKTSSLSESIFEISVFSKAQGFLAAKLLSSQITQVLTREKLVFGKENLVGIWFVKSQTYRLDGGNLRQVKLWFKAIVETQQTVEVSQ